MTKPVTASRSVRQAIVRAFNCGTPGVAVWTVAAASLSIVFGWISFKTEAERLAMCGGAALIIALVVVAYWVANVLGWESLADVIRLGAIYRALLQLVVVVDFWIALLTYSWEVRRGLLVSTPLEALEVTMVCGGFNLGLILLLGISARCASFSRTSRWASARAVTRRRSDRDDTGQTKKRQGGNSESSESA